MRLLFDENLSRKLVIRLGELYPDSVRVGDAGSLESPDSEIWQFAKAGGFVIVTADSDFYELATTIGPRLPRCGSAAGRTQRGMASWYCGGRPSGSRNLRPIPNSRFWFSTAIEARVAAGGK